MKKLPLALLTSTLILAACSDTHTGLWNDVSVSEKALNENDCKFVEKMGEKRHVTVNLECAPTSDTTKIDKQIAGFDKYIADTSAALKTRSLKPTTSLYITTKQILVTSKKAELLTRKAQLVAATVTEAAKAATAAAGTAATTANADYVASRKRLADEFQATFKDDHSLDWNQDFILQGVDGTLDPFVAALSDFVTKATANTQQTGSKLTDAEKSAITQEAESATNVLKDIQGDMNAETTVPDTRTKATPPAAPAQPDGGSTPPDGATPPLDPSVA